MSKKTSKYYNFKNKALEYHINYKTVSLTRHSITSPVQLGSTTVHFWQALGMHSSHFARFPEGWSQLHNILLISRHLVVLEVWQDGGSCHHGSQLGVALGSCRGFPGGNLLRGTDDWHGNLPVSAWQGHVNFGVEWHFHFDHRCWDLSADSIALLSLNGGKLLFLRLIGNFSGLSN